jgi:hypothetical protein
VRKKRKPRYSKDERMLIKLDAVARETDAAEIRSTALSLLSWYRRLGEWTFPQREYVKRIVDGHRATAVLRRPRARPVFSLYAVRVGSALKIGFTRNISKRMKAFRTSSVDVALLGEQCLGRCSSVHAKNSERRLHHELRAYRLERELFAMDALAEFVRVARAESERVQRRLIAPSPTEQLEGSIQ